MARTQSSLAAELGESLAEAYIVNDGMNQLVIQSLAPQAWRAKSAEGGVRTIAAIFAHIHNIRRKWLRLSAPHLKLPKQLDRARCTPKETRAALAASARLCSEMLREAPGGEGRVKQFLRDGWAKPWPAGGAMFAYMLAHDAHHRGQVCMLAHQLGYKLPDQVTSRMWGWEKLWKECGFKGPR